MPLIDFQLRFARMIHAKDRKRLVKSAAKNHKVCHAITYQIRIQLYVP